jgi:hypothetical protein
MGDPRESALRELGLLADSAQALRDVLRAKALTYRKMATMLERGQSVASTMAAVDTTAVRQELTEALDEFEHVRHRVRLALTVAGLEEGMTIGDLGRAFGFSRQLAARYAREARQLHPGPDAGPDVDAGQGT